MCGGGEQFFDISHRIGHFVRVRVFLLPQLLNRRMSGRGEWGYIMVKTNEIFTTAMPLITAAALFTS